MKSKNKFKQTEICGERGPEQGDGRSRTIGEIPENWKVRKLSEFCDVLMGQSPPSSTYNFEGNGLPFFQGRKDFGDKYPQKTMWCSEPTRIANAGDTLLSVRAPVGDVNVAIEKCCIGRGLSALSMKNSNREFLYYLIQHNRQRLKQIFESEGTVFGCVNKDGLKNFEVLLPDNNSEQRAIAKILSDLDEKIEINHQMNKTLESIAQAFFKRWFVDFESTGSFDWQVDELGKYIQFIKGKKPSQISETQLAGYGPQILIDNLNGNPSLYANENGMITVEIDEPIMVMDGASSGRVEIGHSGILGSTLAKVIVTSDRLSNLFLYYFLKDKEPDINQNTTGTSIPHTDKEKIKRYQCNLPPKDLLENFNEIAERIVNKVITNKRETEFLIQIRDSLLPRLMTGKIRIGN